MRDGDGGGWEREVASLAGQYPKVPADLQRHGPFVRHVASRTGRFLLRTSCSLTQLLKVTPELLKCPWGGVLESSQGPLSLYSRVALPLG